MAFNGYSKFGGCVMDKLEMAHQYAKELVSNFGDVMQFNEILEKAWYLADAMQAEADKRNKDEFKKKRKEIREMLDHPNTFIEKEGQHFDDVADVCKTHTSSEEWQPDWSEAPDWAHWWAQDADKNEYWYAKEPLIKKNICEWTLFDEGVGADNIFDCSSCNTFAGNWRESLRKRP